MYSLLSNTESVVWIYHNRAGFGRRWCRPINYHQGFPRNKQITTEVCRCLFSRRPWLYNGTRWRIQRGFRQTHQETKPITCIQSKCRYIYWGDMQILNKIPPPPLIKFLDPQLLGFENRESATGATFKS